MSKTDKLFDAMLKIAIEESVQRELASLPSDEELNAAYPASDILNEKVMRIIAKEKQAKTRKGWSKSYVRIAASLVVLFMVGTVALISLNMTSGISEDFVVGIEYAMPDAPAAPEALAAPVPIMEDEVLGGFANRRSEETEVAQFNFDATDDNLWFYDVYGGFASYTLDIGGQEVFVFEVFEEGMHSSVNWHRDGFDFHISGDRPIDELVKIVERFLE